MMPVGLRDMTGVVHYSFGDVGDPNTALCEADENGRIEVRYSSASLRQTRAPVTCLTCLVNAIEDDARERALNHALGIP